MHSSGYWENAWNEAIERGSSSESAALSREILRKHRAGASFAEQVAERSLAVKTLADEQILSPGSSVLEVGPGLGASTIPLAEQCEKVSVIDPDAEALKILEKNLQAVRLELEARFPVTFDAFDGDAEYDCVYAGFTPAVMHPAGLLRMESFSRGWCALLANYSEYQEKTIDQLYWYLFHRERQRTPSSFFYPINYLLSLGRSTGLRTFRIEVHHQDDTEQLIQLYQTAFSALAKEDKNLNQRIETFFRSSSVNGSFTATYSRTTALLFWQPEKTAQPTRV